MPTRLLLLLCLIGHVFATNPPDVDCLVVHLEYVQCSWNKQGTPEVNYTFSSWFEKKKVRSYCKTYLSENSMNTGCNRPYEISDRFHPFYTILEHGDESFKQLHDLKGRVKLNPPNNLTVKNGSDLNLWFYWNQTTTDCVESQVRHRTNNKKWQYSAVNVGRQDYCINLPISTSRYELQVQSRIETSCGESIFWSDWSEPVVWGSNNTILKERDTLNVPMSVWTPVLYVVGAITLILLVMMLLHIERLRIILIPVVPKPSLIPRDIEDWFQISKGLKESFKANYNERACPVREYCNVSQSDSESSDSCSVTTDQTEPSPSL